MNQRSTIPYMAPPSEEFRQFATSRIEGISMTESMETVELYKEAMEEGLQRLGSISENPSCS